MSLNKDQAIAIAVEFAKLDFESKEYILDFASASARLVSSKSAASYLDSKNSYWNVIFLFKCKDGSAATIDPDHVMVTVDAKSGKAEWLPHL